MSKQFSTLREHQDTKRWGQNINVGAKVTSQGRHGAGQPVVKGTVVELLPHDEARVRLRNGVERKRSLHNLRRI